MKSVTPLILLFLFSISAYSQIEKKSIQLGTYLGFKSSSNEDEILINASSRQGGSDKIVTFETGVQAGYFITKRFVFGLGYALDIETYSNSDFDTGLQSTENVDYKMHSRVNSLGGLFRYYFWPGKNFAVFVEPSYYYGFGTSKQNYRNERNNSFSNGKTFYENEFRFDITRHSIGLTPGITYLINNRIAIELRMGRFAYISENIKLSSISTTTNDPLYDPALISDAQANSKNIIGTLQLDSFLLGVNFILNNSRTKEIK